MNDMNDIEGLLCDTRTHMYVYEKDGNFVIGLTDYGLGLIGDIVFVELPEVGTSYTKGEVFGTIESVKSVIELSMPIGGTIADVNLKLIENPGLLNESPFEDGWLISISSDTAQEDSLDLLEYDDYKEELL